MINILKEIVANKKKELEFLKNKIPIQKLEKSIYFERKIYSMQKSLLNKSGIISEFKRKSPSNPNINLNANLLQITNGYQKANSSGVSILTDKQFFGGEINDLLECRINLSVPILRKDFIINEYQIIESKSIGSDAVLLIASCLTKKEIISLARLSKSLGLEVLIEVHSEYELNKSLNQFIDIVGVNNRNLKLFKTDINISINLSDLIPKEFCKISESGISSIDQIKILKNCGYNGFLIGENFMKSNNPSKKCLKFINSLK